MRTVSRAVGRIVLLSFVMLGGAAVSAADAPDAAQPSTAPAAPAAAGGRAQPPAAAEGACIETEVNGYRALSYDCLNQKMAPDARAKPGAATPGLESEAVTKRPPNQMGLPTPATIGNRMGNTFGTSAYPQRPQP